MGKRAGCIHGCESHDDERDQGQRGPGREARPVLEHRQDRQDQEVEHHFGHERPRGGKPGSRAEIGAVEREHREARIRRDVEAGYRPSHSPDAHPPPRQDRDDHDHDHEGHVHAHEAAADEAPPARLGAGERHHKAADEEEQRHAQPATVVVEAQRIEEDRVDRVVEPPALPCVHEEVAHEVGVHDAQRRESSQLVEEHIATLRNRNAAHATPILTLPGSRDALGRDFRKRAVPCAWEHSPVSMVARSLPGSPRGPLR